ncbi:unnamed protein product [Mytilus coruscus]|uniref:Ig-like domain-containing protein n=1 Tax=Mytilus coruscus TaxID=42192 RepID=A0A6J8ASG8_MYTCO|nr:unnamed protein product [Mytilus coruscus]
MFIPDDPIIQIHGETAVIEGDILNITCFSQAFVPSTFLWYNLSQHGHWYSINETGDSLIIESADRKNSGKYKCLAKNDVISGSAEISVTIQYPPDIQVINRSDSVDCIVRGVPNVYTFYKWNHQSEYGEHIRFLDGFANGTLTLDNTEYPYMRNGIYTCTASNGIRDSNGDLKQTGSHLIKIPGKPVFLNTSYQTNLCSLKRNCELTFYVYSNPSVDRVELKRLNEQENKNRVQFKITSEKQMLPTCWKTFHITGYKIEITSGILEEYDFTTYELKIWNLYDSTSFNFSIVPVEDIQKSIKLKMYLAIFITLSSVFFLYIVTSHIWFYRRSKQSSLDDDNQTESNDEIGIIPSEIINFHPLSEQQQRIVRIDVEHESTIVAEDRNDSSDLSSNHSSIHESSNNNQYLSSNDAIQQDLGETETDSLSWQDVEVDQKHEYQNLYQSIMQEMADSSSIHLTESDVQPPENKLPKRRYINLQI